MGVTGSRWESFSFFVDCGANQAAFCRSSHLFANVDPKQAALCRSSHFFVDVGQTRAAYRNLTGDESDHAI